MNCLSYVGVSQRGLYLSPTDLNNSIQNCRPYWTQGHTFSLPLARQKKVNLPRRSGQMLMRSPESSHPISQSHDCKVIRNVVLSDSIAEAESYSTYCSCVFIDRMHNLAIRWFTSDIYSDLRLGSLHIVFFNARILSRNFMLISA